MKKKIISLILIFAIAALFPIADAHYNRQGISYSIKAKGTGTAFSGIAMVPGSSMYIIGTFNNANNMTGKLSMVGFSDQFYTQSSSTENQWLMTSTRTKGEIKARWDHSHIFLKFSDKDAQGAYVVRNNGLDLLIIGVNLSTPNLNDLFNPATSVLQFHGKLNHQRIFGSFFVISGYAKLNGALQYGFIFANLWIKNLKTYMSLVWFYSITQEVTQLPINGVIFTIPLAKRMRINASIKP